MPTFLLTGNPISPILNRTPSAMGITLQIVNPASSPSAFGPSVVSYPAEGYTWNTSPPDWININDFLNRPVVLGIRWLDFTGIKPLPVDDYYYSQPFIINTVDDTFDVALSGDGTIVTVTPSAVIVTPPPPVEVPRTTIYLENPPAGTVHWWVNGFVTGNYTSGDAAVDQPVSIWNLKTYQYLNFRMDEDGSIQKEIRQVPFLELETDKIYVYDWNSNTIREKAATPPVLENSPSFISMWLPMLPWNGPPLPNFLHIKWPWIK